MKNVAEVVESGLCVGCGVCMDICPSKCIEILHRDLNSPIINESQCVFCGKCIRVCPGKGIKLDELATSYYAGDGIKYDSVLGYYDNCFSGYSTDDEIRFHGASGGAASQFLIFLLDQKIIDGAVVVGFQEKNPMYPRVYIARNKKEVLDAKSSKYCVVAYDGIIKKLEHSDGKFVVVGLPCHIQGFRQAALVSRNIKGKILGYFSIYCSAGKSMKSQDYFLYRYKVERNRIARFSYRDYGCMGSMVFEDSNGNDIVKRIPCLTYYKSAKGFFTPWRCLLCVDHFGELADVCFGDIQTGEFKNDKIGVNSIISRSHYWSDLLLNAKECGCMHLDDLDKRTLIISQSFCRNQKKGAGVVAEFRIRKFLGKKVPQYDQPFVTKDVQVKHYIKTALRIAMRFVGKHQSLWWIIKLVE